VFQLDLFQQDAFQDGTNDVVELRIDTAFQPNAFQSDGFQENAAPVEIPAQEEEQVTGGWPIYYPRKRRILREPSKRPETAPEALEPALVLEDATAALAKRQALRQTEQRDQQITAQLRAIYAEQDALRQGIAGIDAGIAAMEEDDLEAILLLVS
jgi:hypothetical protein